jgi:hypothetical protein
MGSRTKTYSALVFRAVCALGVFGTVAYFIVIGFIYSLSQVAEWPKNETIVVECHDGCAESIKPLTVGRIDVGQLSPEVFTLMAESLAPDQKHYVRIHRCRLSNVTTYDICRSDVIVDRDTMVSSLPTGLTQNKDVLDVNRLPGDKIEQTRYRYEYGDTLGYEVFVVLMVILMIIALWLLAKYITWEMNEAVGRGFSGDPVTRTP